MFSDPLHPSIFPVILGLTGEMPESVRAQGGNFLHQQIADTTVSLLNFASGIRAHFLFPGSIPLKNKNS